MKVSLKTNIIIDLLLFVSMALMSIAGIVLRVVRPLLKAEEEWVRNLAEGIYNCGKGWWFSIHLWAGIAMMVLLAAHLVLHWRVIDGFFCKHIPSKWLRAIIYMVLILLLVVSVVPWLFAI